MHTHARVIKILCGLLAAALLGGCGAVNTEKTEKQVFAMDTVMLLTCYGEAGEAALAAAEETILALEADFDPEGEGSVARLNASAGQAVPVSDACREVLQKSLGVYALTGGALDIGLYPLLRAWGFAGGEHRVPSETEIAGYLSAVRTEAVAVGEDGTACVPAGMQIALGAVAKGCTAQAALNAMAEQGAQYAIVSLGGNVQTLGDTRPDGSLWTVAITDPSDTGAYMALLRVGQTAVVTSGGYQRYFEQDGRTWIHILDPATGYPVQNNLLSVTVVCEDGTLADALSTAMFVLGEEAALEYYRAQGGFEMVLITADSRVIITPGLRESFVEKSDAYTYEYLSY